MITSLFNVTDYGAVADSQTLNTAAIQEAIDACHDAGGGIVRVPAGTFVTGSLALKSRVELHLEPGSVLRGSTDLADYPDFTSPGFHHERAPERSSKALVHASEAEHIAITGPGTLDGAGLAFYPGPPPATGKHPKPDTPRPRLVMFHNCRDVRIEDATFLDSSCWTCWLMQCERVHVNRIKIRGDRRMRNNDGLDIDACRDVTISDCIIRTEDDSLVLRAIQRLYETPAVCENVVVSNCILDSACQGVRVGCPRDGTVRHCTLTNLIIRSTNNGIVFENPHRYLPSGSTATADVHDIQFSNVSIECARTPIKVIVEEGIRLPRLANLAFSDFRIRSGDPLTFVGNPETPVENVRLSNIDIETTGEDAIACRHCRNIKLSGVELSNGNGKGDDAGE